MNIGQVRNRKFHSSAIAFAPCRGYGVKIMASFLRTRLFHLWFMLRRPMTLGVRALVVNDQGQLLLVKHTYISGWHFPGGGVERGESAVESLIRELAEEANVLLEKEPNLIGFFYNNKTSVRDHVALYLCEGAIQSAEKDSDREIVAARFFNLDDLPDDVSPATKRRINEWRSGSAPARFW